MLALPLVLALGLLPAGGPSVPDAGARPSVGQVRGQPSGISQEGAGAGEGQGSGKKKKVIRLDAITVEGRIQKPQAFYILQRSNLNFEELNSSESFLPKVEKSVEKEPF